MADKEIRQDQYDIELPQSIIESFARFLVPKIRRVRRVATQTRLNKGCRLPFEVVDILSCFRYR